MALVGRYPELGPTGSSGRSRGRGRNFGILGGQSSKQVLLVTQLELFTGGVVGVHDINFADISSAEVFGTPVVGATINLTGVPSAQTFGTPGIGTAINFAGIPSAEALGAPGIGVAVNFAGIPSAEAFGLPIIQPVAAGSVDVNLAGIPSAEAVGSPGLVWENQIIFPVTPGRILRKKEEPPSVAPLPPPPEPLYVGLKRTQDIIARIQADIKGYQEQVIQQERKQAAVTQLNETQFQIDRMNAELQGLYSARDAIQQEIEDIDIMFVASIMASM